MITVKDLQEKYSEDVVFPQSVVKSIGEVVAAYANDLNLTEGSEEYQTLVEFACDVGQAVVRGLAGYAKPLEQSGQLGDYHE